MPADENEPTAPPEVPEMVTFTQIARRVSEAGLVSRPITRQGVRYIADTDPDWPVPPAQWVRIGTAWALPWQPVEAFFRGRTSRGRGPNREPRGPRSDG